MSKNNCKFVLNCNIFISHLDKYIIDSCKSLTSTIKDLFYDGGDTLNKFIDSSYSFVYVIILLCFAHIDLVITCVNEDVSTFTTFLDKLVSKHAHFLSLLTNLGLLITLMLDLIVSHKLENALTLTILNIIEVLALICVFWFSVGIPIGNEAAKMIGAFALPLYCLYSLGIFSFGLWYLKYISLKS